MSSESLTIIPFLLRSAEESEYQALSRLYHRLHAEREPDDPPVPAEEQIHQWKNLPDFVEAFAWTVRQGDSAERIAAARGDLLRIEENAHLLQFRIEVLPEYRRQGIGTRLLACICETAEREKRRMLISDTSERIPAGEAFMRRLGASKGLESHTNQLRVEDVDHDLLRRWQQPATDRSDRFETGFWDGPYPEDQIEAISALYEVMNSQPYGSLEIEEFHFTPQQLRQMEEAMLGTGTERWTLYVREKATGEFAGFTEVYWTPQRPYLLQQGNTGVFPAYRGQGLGRRLKAAMLERVLQERPQVTLVRTGNADSNAAMLAINRELGFKPYQSQAVWQIPTEQVRRYLQNHAGA